MQEALPLGSIWSTLTYVVLTGNNTKPSKFCRDQVRSQFLLLAIRLSNGSDDEFYTYRSRK